MSEHEKKDGVVENVEKPEVEETKKKKSVWGMIFMFPIRLLLIWPFKGLAWILKSIFGKKKKAEDVSDGNAVDGAVNKDDGIIELNDVIKNDSGKEPVKVSGETVIVDSAGMASVKSEEETDTGVKLVSESAPEAETQATENASKEDEGKKPESKPEGDPEPHKSMGFFGKFIWFLNICGILYFLYFFAFSVPLDAHQGAVRKNKFLGISDAAVSGPGRVFRMPWLHTIVPVDCSMNEIEFNPEIKEVSGEYFDEVIPRTGLRMPNKNNTYVQVRLAIRYRAYKEPKYGKEGKLIHGGPYHLNLRTGLDPKNIKKNVTNIAESEAINLFGGLTQDGFYRPDPENPEKNYLHQRNEKLLKSLRAIWAPDGIEIIDCLLETFYFEDPNIEGKIFDKNLQIVEEELADARRLQKTKEAELRRVDSEGAANVQAEIQRGTSEAKAIETEGQLYYNQKNAQGLTEVNLAIAEQTKKRENALTGIGGERLLKIRKAKVLSKIMRSGIISGNPTDMIDKEVK